VTHFYGVFLLFTVAQTS